MSRDVLALAAAVARLDPAPLDEARADGGLQVRTDRKYLLPAAALDPLLRCLDGLAVLEIDGRRLFAYGSVYFDTPDLVSYRDAAHGRRRRFKVRTRSYLDTGACMLEVKVRGPRGETVKHRLPYALADHGRLTAPARAFVAGCVPGLDPATLVPSLTTRYLRATLLDRASGTRLTVDADLRCTRPDGSALALEDRVIVETKATGGPTRADRLMWAAGYRPVAISKYGVGMAGLDPALPGNRWHRVLSRHVAPARAAALVAIVALAVAACSGQGAGNSPGATAGATPGARSGGTTGASAAPTSTTGPGALPAAAADNVVDHLDADDLAWNEADVTAVRLTGAGATSDGSGVTADGAVVTVTAPGTYRLSGTLTDGRIIVASPGDGIVRLVLDGVDVASSTGAALVVEDADEVVLILADGSTNVLTDAATYSYPDAATDEPNAALFSTADLTIAGDGSLTVRGDANDGIASKDGLVIAGGTVTVEAADDGIRGKDYLVVEGGTVNVKAGGDGLKSDNDEDASMGYVAVSGGSVTVDAGGDGLQGATDILVTGGTLDVRAGGGSDASLAADASAKGLKGAVDVSVTGGTVTVDAADDALHANGSMTIAGGTLALASGDDAAHADATLAVTGGTIDVSASYEGLESNAITIAGGETTIVADDDGLNAAGGNDGSGLLAGGGPRGGDAFEGGSSTIAISGGTLSVDADGDGIDANGTITMSGGTVRVDGPTSNGNGALDHAGFTISGGELVAAGSAGMAQVPDQSSPQRSLLLSFGSVVAAGSEVRVKSPDGTVIAVVTPVKPFQSIVVSTPTVADEIAYEVYVAGTLAGTTTTADAVSGGFGPGPGRP